MLFLRCDGPLVFHFGSGISLSIYLARDPRVLTENVSWQGGGSLMSVSLRKPRCPSQAALALASRLAFRTYRGTPVIDRDASVLRPAQDIA